MDVPHEPSLDFFGAASSINNQANKEALDLHYIS